MTTWLIVEDEPDLYDTLMAVVEQRGVHPVGITSVEDALELIEDIDYNRYHGDLPEVVMLDIRLPYQGRLEAFGGILVGERLRQSARLDGLKIVLMTAYRLSPDEENECINRAGADLLLYKPFSMSILAELRTL